MGYVRLFIIVFQIKMKAKNSKSYYKKKTVIGNLKHILLLGEYPKTKAIDDLSNTLEQLYNGGRIQEGITCTGRWYSANGQKEDFKGYAGKHSPEFEYQGNRYVRVVTYPSVNKYKNYYDGTQIGEAGTIKWVKVEPIPYEIKNWDEMPKWINPNGSGKAEYFDLESENVIIANIPFYPKGGGNIANQMWQNSTPRGYLNGINVEKITSNGSTKCGANYGGNFEGKCNFLYEAFCLSREPMTEHTIPDSEKEVPDDAFNGCITLEKLIMHSGIESIGKRAFDGLQFKYAYRTETGQLVFARDLPSNENEYTDVVELGKIKKVLDGFDYDILVQSAKLSELAELANFLCENEFSIPYLYGLALVQSGETKSFIQNSDFNIFKKEIPNINDTLQDYSEEERLAFFKFASSLGCFSRGLMMDKKSTENGRPIALEASSLLAKLLKTDEMGLRSLSPTI